MSDNENGLWAAYVRAVVGDMPAQAIADRIAERVGKGVSQPTVSRWLVGRHSGELKPGNVAAFAIAFDRPVLQAFVAADLLTAEEARAGLDEEDIGFVRNLGSITLSSSVRRATRAPRRQRPQPPQA